MSEKRFSELKERKFSYNTSKHKALGTQLSQQQNKHLMFSDLKSQITEHAQIYHAHVIGICSCSPLGVT